MFLSGPITLLEIVPPGLSEATTYASSLFLSPCCSKTIWSILQGHIEAFASSVCVAIVQVCATDVAGKDEGRAVAGAVRVDCTAACGGRVPIITDDIVHEDGAVGEAVHDHPFSGAVRTADGTDGRAVAGALLMGRAPEGAVGTGGGSTIDKPARENRANDEVALGDRARGGPFAADVVDKHVVSGAVLVDRASDGANDRTGDGAIV